MAKVLKGIGASRGIALGKALLLKEEQLVIPNDKIKDVEGEVKKFKQGVQASLKDLENLVEITTTKLGAEKAAIFGAHEEIVQDPAIAHDVEELIKNEQKNAIQAVKQVFDKYHQLFLQMDDPYFKERASDVNDVANRLIKHLLGVNIVDLSTINEEVIIVSDDLTPSQTAQLDKKFVKGFVTNIGGRTSHAAIMARSLELPAVLGLKNITEIVTDGAMISANGTTGEVMIELDTDDIAVIKKNQVEFEKNEALLKTYVNQPTITRDQHKVLVEANIGKPADCEAVLKNGGEGIGLFRSEFLYMENDHFPTEEEQFQAYKEVIDQMHGNLVIIRTLDIGGDKRLSYYQFPSEMNPFLGYRAIRFCLDHPDIFKTQLRALLRASAFGSLGIMFPMIATIEEFNQAKALVEECKAELIAANIKFDQQVQVGMMVEIPAAAVNAKNFAKVADFFSIGTNDLIQYSMAADRMNQSVAYLYQPLNPSLLNLIKMTIDGAHTENKWVGMCGEMAGDQLAIPLLLGMGLDAFSMSATSILKTRSIINNLDYQTAQTLSNQALMLSTSKEIESLVQAFLKKNNL